MPKMYEIQPEFVELAPVSVEPGVLYVSPKYKNMVHLCCCGCGNKVVTPLSPTGWEMAFNGRAISVNPSIGNWNLECQSHYWISHNRVEWAKRWSRERIDAGFAWDREEKRRYYEGEKSPDKARGGPDARPSRIKEWWAKVRR